jgi:7,8-dihydropterin-6-yl-methyl-4-(beta-D-ribofuranosyl)aminobenzene 5'-phosphate synthase
VLSSGLEAIIKEADRIGHVYGLIEGLHGFNAFTLIHDMETICATHCTQFKEKIKRLHPEKFIEGGAGKIIEI